MNIYLKWGLLVGFNSVFSILFALDFMKSFSGALGVILGMATFVFLYAKFDSFLSDTRKKEWQMALTIGVGSMIVLLLYPAIPMLSGALALDISGSILHLPASGAQHSSFFSIYLTTIIDGILLSLLVFVLACLVRILFLLKPESVTSLRHRE